MSSRWTARLAALLVVGFVFASSASAYYYYVTFSSRTAPFNPIVKKFDLNALTNNIVPFFVSDRAPTSLVPGDTYQAIVSEIRSAADAWNQVATSQIRLAYGGLFTPGTSETAPGIDVEFSNDIAPGLVALGGPAVTGNTVVGPNGQFIPITRSKLVLQRDFSQIGSLQRASFSELFFVTLVHEFGHTMGLQHTLTSSVMSTQVTSTSSKATPLGADDIAAISLLYPAPNYLATVGSISGRVTMNGGNTGVNLASVVALSAASPAISTLTNPDGTYQINGVPPGQYYVYVHPLPPALQGEATPDNITFPKDLNGRDFTPNYTAFGTEFYAGSSGTRDWQQAHGVFVYAANVTSGIDFKVNLLNAEAVHSVRAYGYSYQSNQYLITAPVTVGASTPAPLVASGAGLLTANNALTPGLTVNTLGTIAKLTDLQAYPPPTPYIAVYAQLNLGTGPGPKHLLFSTPNDLYVLPAAFMAVTSGSPSIASITPTLDANGNKALLIAGTPFDADTRILFDGLPGLVESVNGDGTLTVLPPIAPGNYTATVVALNLDGQTSLSLQPNPPTYTYDPSPVPSLTVTPSSLSPGADPVVDITGVNTNFVQGQTIAGFGTSDVTVKQITVLSPTHISVTVTPNAFVQTSGISVTTGLTIISQALGYQITTTNSPSKAHR